MINSLTDTHRYTIDIKQVSLPSSMTYIIFPLSTEKNDHFFQKNSYKIVKLAKLSTNTFRPASENSTITLVLAPTPSNP